MTTANRAFVRPAALLCGAAAAALSFGSAVAQTAGPPVGATSDDSATLGEIIVTARRRSESLQTVPQSVSAVTAETIAKLNITQFADVQRVVPGLGLDQSYTGGGTSVALRGLNLNGNTGSQPAVAVYFNDAPIQGIFLFSSLFDVGQIEVLRGPQGTTRGVSAPSGAITVTTHRPDLESFGGYASTVLTDHQGRNAQAAINAPIIKDVLAVRAAAFIDETQADGVRSINNNLRPEAKSTAERLSLRFEPNDALHGDITYQHVDMRFLAFDQVSGPGQGTLTAPPITPEQRAAVEDGVGDSRTHFDVVTAQLDSRIFGQHLSYVGSYQHVNLFTRSIGSGGDAGNSLPGAGLYGYVKAFTETTSQEIRLSSEPDPSRLFDYTVGGYYNWQQNGALVDQTGPILLGAFGSPLGPPNTAAFNPLFQIPLSIAVPSSLQETSLFGSLTLHLGPKTELSGGIRHIWSVGRGRTAVSLGNGTVALPAVALGGSCGALPSTYPGTCNLTLPTAGVVADAPSHTSDAANVYNVSLSHHITRDTMVYANTGTAFTPGVGSFGLSGGILTSPDPQLQSLIVHPAERSRAYEVGLKTTFLDGRARFNADVFRQRFHNLPVYVPNVNYIGAQGATTFGFTQSVDALIQGFEIDTAVQVTKAWNIALEGAYSDGKVQGSLVPCNQFDAAGQPAFNRGFISLCPGGSVSTLPLWNATLTSEYVHPVSDKADGFIRGLLTYYPENKNRVEPGFTVPAYSLLNLYAGVRDRDGAWELSVFVRNAFATQRTTDRSPVPFALNGALGNGPPGGLSSLQYANVFPSSSGYFATSVTAPREVGVSLRYAWGSR